jgi:hypothetical protein
MGMHDRPASFKNAFIVADFDTVRGNQHGPLCFDLSFNPAAPSYSQKTSYTPCFPRVIPRVHELYLDDEEDPVIMLQRLKLGIVACRRERRPQIEVCRKRC